jgi:DMSO/TMAO reductase YedYZ molybdopterin-dependent catalytic subunit
MICSAVAFNMRRRRLLAMALAYGATRALGAHGEWHGLSFLEGEAATSPAGEPFATGRLVRHLPFVGEGQPPLDRTLGSGLGGRRYLDLSGLDAASLETSNEKFFIRTRFPDQLNPNEPWVIRLHGKVKSPIALTMADLASLAAPAGAHLLECSGNDRQSRFGMISSARWSGVPLPRILAKAGVLPTASQILVSGFDSYSRTYPGSEPGASWVFQLNDLMTAKAFLATGMNGTTLPPDHGFPVRLVVPGWYGCVWVKWVNEIVLVGDDAPGTSQMREFAGRTHQRRIPELARDFEPALIDLAALPVRVEQWLSGGSILYRIVGILWGGSRPNPKLVIRLGAIGSVEPVTQYDHRTHATWTLWSHAWRPTEPGEYTIALHADDPTARTRRLDSGHYLRRVLVEEI